MPTQVKAAIQRLQETATKPTASINNTPITTRIMGVQVAAKQLQAAAKEVATKNSQGPAGNTQSKAHNTLERAMYAACFIDNKNGDAQRLTSQRYPAALFAAALTVMNIKSGNTMKHQ